MPGTRVIPEGSPPPLAPYSPGMQSGNTVYVSGTLPLDAGGNVVGAGDVRALTVLRPGKRMNAGFHAHRH